MRFEFGVCFSGLGLGAILLATSLTGCASNGNSGNRPSANALPAGNSCQSLQRELKSMDANGVPAIVEAVNSGQSVSAQNRAQADRYNELLNKYLSARCHT